MDVYEYVYEYEYVDPSAAGLSLSWHLVIRTN